MCVLCYSGHFANQDTATQWVQHAVSMETQLKKKDGRLDFSMSAVVLS